MSLTTRIRSFGLMLALSGAVSSAHAGPPTSCEKIAQDVYDSVTKEPSKVIMILEDHIVIKPTCACEIVKAAITASHADAPLVKQIVDHAIALAPKMTPIIIECANAVAPGAVSTSDEPKTVAKSGKDAKNVLPEPVTPPKETVALTGEIESIRGVYLMAPAVGGFITPETPTGDKKKPKRTTRRRQEVTPLSPSNPMANWTP